MEIAIRADSEIVTLINVFVVEPDNQEKLMRLLEEGTETLFSRQPGYIAASFHRSRDGRRVVNTGSGGARRTWKPIGASTRSGSTSSA